MKKDVLLKVALSKNVKTLLIGSGISAGLGTLAGLAESIYLDKQKKRLEKLDYKGYYKQNKLKRYLQTIGKNTATGAVTGAVGTGLGMATAAGTGYILKKFLKKKDISKHAEHQKKPPYLKDYKPTFFRPEKRIGQLEYLKGGNSSDVTSKDVAKYFNKKHNLNVGYNNFTHPFAVNSFYGTKEMSKSFKNTIDKINKKNKLPFFSRLFLGKDKEKSLLKEYKQLKLTLDKNINKPHGNIFIDKEIEKYSPEIVAHELGHAYNYNKGKGRHIFKALRNPIAEIGLPVAGLLTLLALRKKNPVLGTALGSASAMVVPATVLVDEYLASHKGSNAIKQMGGTPHLGKLKSGFMSYLGFLAPELFLNGYTLAKTLKK